MPPYIIYIYYDHLNGSDALLMPVEILISICVVRHIGRLIVNVRFFVDGCLLVNSVLLVAV